MKIPTIIVDSNIILKLFSGKHETHVDLAQRLFRDIREGVVHAVSSRFLLVEFVNILVKKKGYGYKETLELASEIEGSGIEFVPLEQLEMSQLIDAMRVHHVSAYDGLYVALAKQQQCQLLTDDVELGRILGIGISLTEYYGS